LGQAPCNHIGSYNALNIYFGFNPYLCSNLNMDDIKKAWDECLYPRLYLFLVCEKDYGSWSIQDASSNHFISNSSILPIFSMVFSMLFIQFRKWGSPKGMAIPIGS